MIKVAMGLLALVVCGHGMAMEKVKSAGGTYKDALRKAGEAGKPLMVDFYTDWCPHCKRLDAAIHQIPNTMAKFAYFRVNAEKDTALAKQFNVTGFPTVCFVTPDGKEFEHWSGAFEEPDPLKKALEGVLAKAGPLETKPKVKTPQSAAAETAAGSKLKSAEMYVKVNKKKDAEKLLKEILDKYPDTDAATQAQADLDSLSGGDTSKK